MSELRHASECDHQWVYYGTLKMPEQGPPIEIEQCIFCGVQRKKQVA